MPFVYSIMKSTRGIIFECTFESVNVKPLQFIFSSQSDHAYLHFQNLSLHGKMKMNFSLAVFRLQSKRYLVTVLYCMRALLNERNENWKTRKGKKKKKAKSKEWKSVLSRNRAIKRYYPPRSRHFKLIRCCVEEEIIRICPPKEARNLSSSSY